MMKAPLRPGTRPRRRCTASSVKDTSTDGPGFAATPKGDGPRPQDWRGGVRVRGAPSTTYLLLTYYYYFVLTTTSYLLTTYYYLLTTTTSSYG